jgi:Polyketide cyclase / dehydrase and lipid transport
LVWNVVADWDKYWPQWHPASVSVSGAVDQPMHLGDVIREHARIGGLDGEGDWTVVEYERPRRLMLRVLGTPIGDVQITYRFEARDGAVEYTRVLEFDASNLPENLRMAVERQMETDSAAGLSRLKQLVEQQLLQRDQVE